MLPDKMQGDATVRTVFRRLKLSADASPAGEARTNRVSGVTGICALAFGLMFVV